MTVSYKFFKTFKTWNSMQKGIYFPFDFGWYRNKRSGDCILQIFQNLKNLKFNAKRYLFSTWFWLVFYPIWYCSLRKTWWCGGGGGGDVCGLLNGQNPLSVTKVICRQSLIKFVSDWNSPNDRNSPVHGSHFVIWKAPIHFEQAVGEGRAGLLFLFCISLRVSFALDSISSATNSKNLFIITPMLWWMERIKGFCILLCTVVTCTLRAFWMFGCHVGSDVTFRFLIFLFIITETKIYSTFWEKCTVIFRFIFRQSRMTLFIKLWWHIFSFIFIQLRMTFFMTFFYGDRKFFLLQMQYTILQRVKQFLNVKMINLEKIK